VDEDARLRGVYWSPVFRRRRLLNLVAGRPWFWKFGDLLSASRWETTTGSHHFRRDAREAFERVEEIMAEKKDAEGRATLESLMYRLVGQYVARKVKSKHGKTWEEVKDDARQKHEYDEACEKVARDAFLGVRSRTGPDFVEYFPSTLGSVPHHLAEADFAVVSRALLSDTDTVRALTLLALSARG
jgi:CRISPR-associated protein Cmx8